MKILIIEDNPGYSALLTSFLNEEGFETSAALSGKEGVKAAFSYLPDLILVDYELGDMTGYDVAIAIKCMRATANTPFILLSSLAADPAISAGFKKLSNCRATLVKTQPLAAILETIEKAITGYGRATAIKQF